MWRAGQPDAAQRVCTTAESRKIRSVLGSRRQCSEIDLKPADPCCGFAGFLDREVRLHVPRHGISTFARTSRDGSTRAAVRSRRRAPNVFRGRTVGTTRWRIPDGVLRAALARPAAVRLALARMSSATLAHVVDLRVRVERIALQGVEDERVVRRATRKRIRPGCVCAADGLQSAGRVPRAGAQGYPVRGIADRYSPVLPGRRGDAETAPAPDGTCCLPRG